MTWELHNYKWKELLMHMLAMQINNKSLVNFNDVFNRIWVNRLNTRWQKIVFTTCEHIFQYYYGFIFVCGIFYFDGFNWTSKVQTKVWYWHHLPISRWRIQCFSSKLFIIILQLLACVGECLQLWANGTSLVQSCEFLKWIIFCNHYQYSLVKSD